MNFSASVVLTRGLKAELVAAKGSVVNIAPIAGTRAHPFVGAAYATLKAALAALSHKTAHDFGPLGVRVNAIAPGEFKTSMLSHSTDKIAEGLTLRRLGQTDEVADLISFLCLEKLTYISGSEIEINCGQHI